MTRYANFSLSFFFKSDYSGFLSPVLEKSAGAPYRSDYGYPSVSSAFRNSGRYR
jgi:hypothetical protein